MTTVKVELTGMYTSFRTQQILYNYVVVSGDTEQYIADKRDEGFLALMDDGIVNKVKVKAKPKHIGLPRYVIPKNIGKTCTIVRIPRMDGSIYWGPE